MNAPANEALRQAASLMALGGWLKSQGYRFAAVAPATHARMHARQGDAPARGLRDVFGWRRAFASGAIDACAIEWLQDAGLLEQAGDGLLRSSVAFSTLMGEVFVHDPHDDATTDAISFGPDMHRCCRVLCCELTDAPLASPCRVLHVDCGAGAAGIVAAREQGHADVELVLADAEPRALRYASVNAAVAGRDATLAPGAGFDGAHGDYDLVLACPAWREDAARRLAGAEADTGRAERIVRDGLHHLAPRGRLLLCTCTAVVGGRDPLFESLDPLLQQCGWKWRYSEIEPDVCCGLLEDAAFADVERIAAVGLVVERSTR